MCSRLPIYLCLLIACFAVTTGNAQLGGTYTIDSSKAASSTNYKSFGNAVNDLVKGKRTDGGTINGPGIKSIVTFKVADGVYYEQIQIDPIKGSSPAKSITFISASQDSMKVSLIDTNSVSTVNNFTLYLNGESFINFRKMTISRGGSGNYTNVIQIDNRAKGNTFQSDRIIGKKFINFTYPYPSLIYSQGNFPYSNDSGNTFRNNLMKYNCYAFTWYATSVDPEQNTIIENNTIDSSYNAGIFMEYQSGIRIANNTISNIINSFGLGIYSYYSYGKNEITGNKILMPNGGEAMGLEYNETVSTDTSLVANNFISIGGTSFTAGIYVYGGDFIRFYYNNVLLSGSSPYASYAASLTSTYYGGSHFELLNNNLINTQTGSSSYTIYNSNTAISISDYNNFYTKGKNLGYSNTLSYTDLSAWQSGTALDSHSLSISPNFVSNSNLHITNVYLNGKAKPLRQVKKDIDGQTRDPKLPDIGADEISPVHNDAGIVSIDSPAVGCSGTKNIYVRLRNYGFSAITSVQTNWQVDTSKIFAFAFTGSLAVNADTFIKIGSYNFSFPSFNSKSQIRVWTKLPNGVHDSSNANDTASILTFHGMSGSYSIGGVSPNFATFSQAAAALELNGVCGAVTFNVRDGIYQEQVEFGPIAGTGAGSRVNFQSQSGDSSKVTLTFPATNSYTTQNFTLGLKSSSWISFRKMTISRTGLGYYGNVIQLSQNSSFNIFSNNLITGAVIPPSDYSYYSDANIIYAYGDGTNQNVFRNNYIRGGYYNCFFNNSSRIPGNGNVFSANIFDSSFWGGIYLQNNIAPLIRYNIIQNVQSNYGYGIQMQYVTGGTRIFANKIVLVNGGMPLYLGYGTQGSAASRMLIANNFISLSGSSGSNDIGIDVDYADSIDIFYNNILVYDPSSASTCLNINSINQSVSLFNNNVFNAGGGYALFLPSAALLSSNNNNFYCANGDMFFYNSSISSLAAWKTLSGLDTNSLSTNPLFYSFSDLHVRCSALDGAARPIPNVITDIDGQGRNSSYPDIGADEFTPYLNDAGIASIDSPAAGFCPGSWNVYARIRNYGTDTLKSLNITWSVNGVSNPVIIFRGNIPKGGELQYKLGRLSFASGVPVKINVYSFFPNSVTDSQPSNDSSKIILNTGLSGSYLIGNKKADYTGFKSAVDDAMQRGLCGATIFNVQNGIYHERVEIGSPPGISPTKTLGIQSLSGDSSAVVLDNPASNMPGNNYTLLLYGTNYFTLKGITISRSGKGKFDNVIAVTAESSNNLFSNNRIIGMNIPAFAASSYTSSSALIYCVPSANNRNRYINNYMKGNFWAFYATGESAYSTAAGTVFSSNTIDSTYGGVFMEYQDSFIVEKNRITNLLGNYYGIQAYYGGVASTIRKNYIYLPSGGYGIYLFFIHGSPSAYSLISDNIINVQNNGYGLYASYADYSGFYFNTIKTSGGLAAAGATFIGYGASTCEFFNNIVFNNAKGIPLVGGKNIITASSNNDYYTNGASTISWDGSNYSSIGSFKKSTGLEKSSLVIKPVFSDSLRFSLVDSSSMIHGAKPIALIKDDIYDISRNLKTPDMGAVEKDPADTDLSVVAILSPSSGDCGDSFAKITVDIKNDGLKPLSNFTVAASVKGSPTSYTYTFPSKGKLAAGKDTILTLTGNLNTFSGGSFQIKTNAFIKGDKHRYNDTLTASISIAPRLVSPYAKNGNTCGPGLVKLLASSHDSILWYDSAGNYLQSGDSVITPVLSSTTTYFAQAIPHIDLTGAFAPDSAGGYNPSPDIYQGLLFDALGDFKLDSITIYPEHKGLLQINIRDSLGRAIARKKVNINSSTFYAPVKVALGINIPAGKNYSIDAIGSNVGSMYANGVNSKGTARFPYVNPGILSIKDNTDSSGKTGKYYYFYNWVISRGFACASPKEKILAVVGSGTKPLADFSNIVSCNGTAVFYDSSKSTGTPLHTYFFEFGDSSTKLDTTSNNLTHYYGKRGIYRALLTVTTTGGCSDSTSRWVNVIPSLNAAFTIDNACLGDSIHLHDGTYSLSYPLTYSWDMGDGDSSIASNPVHLYQGTGQFRIRLLVTSPLCTDTVSHLANVFALPVPDFTFSGKCLDNITTFINLSRDNDSGVKYAWGFGDGDTSIDYTAHHLYKKAGKFSASLMATNIHNCIAKKVKIADIYPLPNPRFTFTDSSNIFRFSAVDNSLKAYEWDFGDSLYSSKGPYTAHAYVYPKKYQVVLVVRDSNNCSNEFDTLVQYAANGIEKLSQPEFYSILYPNPFRNQVTLAYHLTTNENVNLEIMDINGKILSRFDAGKQMPGIHSILLEENTNNISTQGIYIVRIIAGNNISTLRLIRY